mmetsp:Transcript_55391/g.177722  ORF Transcript_55391/g.177722 Transcript_55391/m.177722 type:complete len:272 (-) Transcript_55391:674-1489(-)
MLRANGHTEVVAAEWGRCRQECTGARAGPDRPTGGRDAPNVEHVRARRRATHLARASLCGHPLARRLPRRDEVARGLCDALLRVAPVGVDDLADLRLPQGVVEARGALQSQQGIQQRQRERRGHTYERCAAAALLEAHWCQRGRGPRGVLHAVHLRRVGPRLLRGRLLLFPWRLLPLRALLRLGPEPRLDGVLGQALRPLEQLLPQRAKASFQRLAKLRRPRGLQVIVPRNKLLGEGADPGLGRLEHLRMRFKEGLEGSSVEAHKPLFVAW